MVPTERFCFSDRGQRREFFSSLADNALLIVSIALLASTQSPAWMTPMLKLFFVLSYVLLAPFVGAFADAFPKGRVMFITNLVKVCFVDKA